MVLINHMNENRYYKKKKRKKKKKKKKTGLGWGNPNYYGAAPAGETSGFSGGDGGGIGEKLLRLYVKMLVEDVDR